MLQKHYGAVEVDLDEHKNLTRIVKLEPYATRETFLDMVFAALKGEIVRNFVVNPKNFYLAFSSFNTTRLTPQNITDTQIQALLKHPARLSLRSLIRQQFPESRKFTGPVSIIIDGEKRTIGLDNITKEIFYEALWTELSRYGKNDTTSEIEVARNRILTPTNANNDTLDNIFNRRLFLTLRAKLPKKKSIFSWSCQHCGRLEAEYYVTLESQYTVVCSESCMGSLLTGDTV